jgi:hypothetical protein
MSHSKDHSLVAILEALSPAEIAQDEVSSFSTACVFFLADSMQVLQRSFQRFFERGTQAQCQTLLPQSYKLRRVAAHESKAQPKPVSDALEQIQNCKGISIEQLDRLWIITSHSTLESRTTNAYMRIGRLIQDVDRLEELQSLQVCRIRLELLFLSHDLDLLDAAVPKTKLSQGRGRRSVALAEICQRCQLKPEKLKELVRRSYVYLSIAKQGGIGSLLAIGDRQSV